MLEEIFPTLDRAMTAARQFLCGRDEKTAALDDFRVQVGALRIPPDRIRAVIATHAERMHNIGQIKLEDVPKLRSSLEPYALSYSGKCMTILGASFDPAQADTDIHRGRLELLAQALKEV